MVQGNPKPLSIREARRIAGEVLAAEYPDLRLLGVSAGEGRATYTEIFLAVANCHTEPCRVSLGVRRGTSEADFRQDVIDQIREHVTPE